MAHIRIQREHQMDREAVKRHVEDLAKTLEEKFAAHYEWQDDTLHFSRKHAEGHITVGDGQIDIEIRLGLVLRPMKRVVEQTVTEYLDEHLG